MPIPHTVLCAGSRSQHWLLGLDTALNWQWFKQVLLLGRAWEHFPNTSSELSALDSWAFPSQNRKTGLCPCDSCLFLFSTARASEIKLYHLIECLSGRRLTLSFWFRLNQKCLVCCMRLSQALSFALDTRMCYKQSFIWLRGHCDASWPCYAYFYCLFLYIIYSQDWGFWRQTL